MKKTVVLIGFSTAGKSHYSDKIESLNPFEISFQDSDKFLSKEYGGHIYNIFMSLGREEAIAYIEKKEKEFISHLSSSGSTPTLVAAGPFLLIREGWENYYRTHNPFVIHLNKKPESVFKGLIKRKIDQKNKLDISNPNFGSWDKDVTTQEMNGKYVDNSDEDSLKNITRLIKDIEPYYAKYRHEIYDSDLLKDNPILGDELIKAIINRLK